MEYTTLFLFLLSFLLTISIYSLTISGRRKSRLPPGPHPFPVIGNLLELGNNPHQSLAKLSKRYGPLMSLMLGNKTTIVISSPEMAKEFYHTHDRSFSGRPITEAIKIEDHHKFSFVWLSEGDEWRRLRRITKEYMFSLQCLERSEIQRQNKDLFIAGTDTSTNTLEWAMAELIRNPKKLAIARSEISELVQYNNMNLKEKDIIQLPYLKSVIKETLRLHPPAPFLIPHRPFNDVEVHAFTVPKNAQILCNVWAMGRDSNIWSDPETFMPERFLDVEIDYRGQYFEFIPFGTGRRMCPGMNMAHRMLHMILGSLIHKFDWKLEGDMRAQDLDMGENFGITLQKHVPLKAIPIKL